MSGEWKPGDVALIQAGTSCARIGLRFDGGWRTVGGLMSDDSTPGGSIHRRLVVIDPEDRKQVGRLVRLFWENGTDDCDDPVAMQAALREFADPKPPKPPKPPEPTGLGAVVESAAGSIFVRVRGPREAPPWVRAGVGSYCEWAGIDVVRVLSEGVTA